MAPNPPTSVASRRAQTLSLNRSGSPVAARPRNVEKSTACMTRCARVKRTKKRPAGLTVGWVWTGASSTSSMWTSIGRFLADLMAGSDQPQHRVDHKKRQYPDEQQIHKQAHEIERRVQLPHPRVGMRLVLPKVHVGARMALA